MTQPLLVAMQPLVQPAFFEVRPPADKSRKPVVVRSGSDSSKPPIAVPKKAPAGDAAVPESKTRLLGPAELQGINMKQRKRPAPDATDGDPSSKLIKLPDSKGIAKGLSLAPSIRQGLIAKDGRAIEKVLEQGKRGVVDSTVADLSGEEAFDLLQECSKTFMGPHRCTTTLAQWIQSLLVQHCAFISSQPMLQEALQPLYAAMRAQCTCYRTLVRLSGRLQVARDLAKQAQTAVGDESASVRNMRTPLLQYVEGDEELAEASAAEESSDHDGDASEGSGDLGLDLDDIFDDDM